MSALDYIHDIQCPIKGAKAVSIQIMQSDVL